jgi:glycosyltransferase involved in cell wall biosynthesis
MRVIYFCYEPRERPSARVRGYRFAAELERRGHHCTVVSLADRFGLHGEQPYHLSEWRKVLYNYRVYRELGDTRGALLVLQKICYHLLAPLWIRQRDCSPLVVDLDDWDFDYQPFRTLRFVPGRTVEALNRFVLRRADVITVASPHLARKASELAPAGTPIVLVPTGVDLRQPFRPPAGRAGGPFTFCWIGQVWGARVYRAVIRLIRALARVDRELDVRLELLGSFSSFEPAIRAELQAAGLEERVVLRSWIAPEAVPEYLSTVDCGLYVVDGADDYNQSKSPTKIFEYMAASLPTIATAIGEAARVIEHERTGLLAGDDSALAHCMEHLARNPEAARAMGRRAREVVAREYSLERLAGTLEAAYRRAWERAQPPTAPRAEAARR